MGATRPLLLPIILTLLLPATAGGPPTPCRSPAHRQFDFWLGDWEVRTPDGAVAGTNRITGIQGGCGLLENWAGASGMTGTSLNTYDAARGLWHQTWVDSRGSLLLLDGAFEAGKMVLSGTTRSPQGKTVTDRITWEPTSAGAVRQLWEQSEDGGKSWTVAFDGRYTRRR
ncbi:MAG TPA: hypothetical protein VFT43_00895 [Candidatus Polarisedimenticolia bacterium]|nr:hypothetical protein [Candidatus Polarisedimenticolia bacterium]